VGVVGPSDGLLPASVCLSGEEGGFVRDEGRFGGFLAAAFTGSAV
jgi:hypothetical protein